MSGTIIMRTKNHILTSHGNGWAYTLERDGTDESVFLQDSDADQFRAELDAMEAADENRPTEEILAELFDQYTPAN